MSIISNLRKSKFISDFISMFTSNVSILLIGLLISIINNRILGPDGMGIYAVLTNFSLLFVSLAELGIRQSTIYYAGKQKYHIHDIISANISIWLISSLIGVTIYFVIFDKQNFDITIELIILSSLIIPISIANSFINGIMLSVDKIKKNSNFNIINGFIKLLLTVLLVSVLQLDVFGSILALLLTTASLTFRKYYFLSKKLNLNFNISINKEIISSLISKGILYGLALFLMTNQKTIPILVMTGKLGAHEIGIYNAGATFATLLYNVYNALAPVIFVRSSKAIDPIENSLKVQKLMRVVFVILILISIVLHFSLEYIIPLMYGNKFTDSILITKILLFGIIFYNVFLILNMDLAGRGKPWIAIYALIPVTIINYASNYFLIDNLGNIGAACSTSLSMAIASFIFLYIYSKSVNISLREILTPRINDWDFINKIIKK